MKQHRLLATIILTSLATTLVARAEDTALGRPGKGQAWGYRGDGSGVMDAKPPVQFNPKPVWSAPLPTSWGNSGNSSPIVVAGKVLLTVEPNRDCPWVQLLCFEAATGKQLWAVPLNHLPAVEGWDPATRQAAEKAWAEHWRKRFEIEKLRAQMRANQDNPEKMQALEAEVAALGVTGNMGLKGYSGVQIPEANLIKPNGQFGKATLNVDTWTGMGNLGGANLGEGFATPTSDGTHVYAVTAQYGFFCVDLNGKLVWTRHYPALLGKGNPDYCRMGRSPLIYQDLLLSDMGGSLRAIDRKTGTLRWQAPAPAASGHYSYVSPTVIRTTNGIGVVLHGGPDENLHAYRLPEGKPLNLQGFPAGIVGTLMVTKHDEPDVVFFQGGDEHGGGFKNSQTKAPLAARFALEGDTLKATILWQGAAGKTWECQWGLLYFQNRVYLASPTAIGVALDAKTGAVVGNAGRWTTAHLLFAANGRIYGDWGQHKHQKPETAGTWITAFDRDFKKAGETFLPGIVGGGASTFALAGDRIYIRRTDKLLCFP